MKKTVSNLLAGQVVKAGYIRRPHWDYSDANRFVGFKVGELYFSKLQDLKEYFGVRNLKDLEAAARRLNDKVSVTAEFQNVSDDPYFWGAYLWEGAFRVGTSADRLVLKFLDQD